MRTKTLYPQFMGWSRVSRATLQISLAMTVGTTNSIRKMWLLVQLLTGIGDNFQNPPPTFQLAPITVNSVTNSHIFSGKNIRVEDKNYKVYSGFVFEVYTFRALGCASLGQKMAGDEGALNIAPSCEIKCMRVGG